MRPRTHILKFVNETLGLMNNSARKDQLADLAHIVDPFTVMSDDSIQIRLKLKLCLCAAGLANINYLDVSGLMM